MSNTGITFINAIRNKVHMHIAEIRHRKWNIPPHSQLLPINCPHLDMTNLSDSRTALKPSLHKRGPLTKFLFIVGICCASLSSTIFPEVSFRSTVPTQIHNEQQQHATHSPSSRKNPERSNKKKIELYQNKYEQLHQYQATK